MSLTPTTDPPILLERIGQNGSPVMLMHGWGADHRSLLPLANCLRPASLPLLVDLPGFGRSPSPQANADGRPWGTLDYARRIVGLMDSEGYSQLDFIGHSFGGRVAVQLAAHFPERVRTVVLIAAAGLPPRRRVSARLSIAAKLRAGRAISWASRFLGQPGRRLKQWFIDKAASADYRASSGEMRPVLVRAVNEDLTIEAAGINCPVLLIWGAEDPTTPVEMGRRYASLITGSQLLVIPGTGHHPFSGGGVHVCARYIGLFLAAGPRHAGQEA